MDRILATPGKHAMQSQKLCDQHLYLQISHLSHICLSYACVHSGAAGALHCCWRLPCALQNPQARDSGLTSIRLFQSTGKSSQACSRAGSRQHAHLHRAELAAAADDTITHISTLGFDCASPWAQNLLAHEFKTRFQIITCTEASALPNHTSLTTQHKQLVHHQSTQQKYPELALPPTRPSQPTPPAA
jgi:hypothetical protein